ncbi:MAG: chromosomal replication initiator protein DnaA [Lentisphaeria bacterium]
MNLESAHEIWAATSSRLQSLLNEDTYDRWIAGIIPLEVEGKNTLKLGVSNDIFCEWLQKNYNDVIVRNIEEATGRAFKIQFEGGHNIKTSADDENSRPEKASPKTEQATRQAPQSQPARIGPEAHYNRRFTFDTYVVGENNKFAHAACSAVAKAPGKAYNPLFIHGGTGLGKTHLLQAIAQEVSGRRKSPRIEYLSSEEFANNFIDALRDRALPKFRKRYRNVDLILIDDVHFFTGKERLQEEFFHTFNALYNRHKQIVLTSDRSPHEIGGLEKRLVSRFEWGLTTEILAPDFETRLAILRKKQADHTVKIEDEILSFVASRIKSNIRRLEGALIRLVSFVSMTAGELTIDKVEQLLRPLLEEETSNSMTLADIQRAVAEHYDIRIADMSSKRRPQNIAFPRQVAMYLCRRLTDYSSPAIAESFNRSHATVLHASNTIEQKISTNLEFRHTLGKLERKLAGTL